MHQTAPPLDSRFCGNAGGVMEAGGHKKGPQTWGPFVCVAGADLELQHLGEVDLGEFAHGVEDVGGQVLIDFDKRDGFAAFFAAT